ncbi:hypothetical protein SPONN_1582 [uncultured Candidatus Thioglobus sp.]|nr:hypothetical protein SPONN_1582 [uncultured Candidatus Thioglobus sp.]
MKNLPYLDCHWSEKNKYLAVLAPKSACSSLKVMIMNNEGKLQKMNTSCLRARRRISIMGA